MTACPKCGCTDLVRYSSLNLKHCPDCKTEIPWEGKPLIGPSRSDRKINIDESVSEGDT